MLYDSIIPNMNIYYNKFFYFECYIYTSDMLGSSWFKGWNIDCIDAAQEVCPLLNTVYIINSFQHIICDVIRQHKRGYKRCLGLMRSLIRKTMRTWTI